MTDRRKRAQAYVILLLVLALLCLAVGLRLAHVELGHPGKLSWGLIIVMLAPAIKCAVDLFDKRLDAETRLLRVAALVPASLFLLSFCAPPAVTLWLLALAAVTLLTVTVAAFLTGRRSQPQA